jgi:hypothetical protein
MLSLREQAQVVIGMPLKHQILRTIANSSEPAGLTVHDVSKKLCLNTKTCAKVLEEMSTSGEGVKATGYRYGRVYMFKYSLDLKDEEEVSDTNEYVAAINPHLYQALNSMPSSLKEDVRKALLVASQDDARGSSRMRVTQQTFLRALFVLHRLNTSRVLSVHELKRLIKDDLEPNVKWSLDKRTVLRIVWKLQRLHFLRQMCFRIKLSREDNHDIEYLGDDYHAIDEDKQTLGLVSQYDAEGCLVVYRVLVTLPEIHEDMSEVRSHTSLTNPTNRQPIIGGDSFKKLQLFSTSLHSKQLKQIVSKMNLAAKRIRSLADNEDVAELLLVKSESLETKEEGGETKGRKASAAPEPLSLPALPSDPSVAQEEERPNEAASTELTSEAARMINSAYRKCVFVKWIESFMSRSISNRYLCFISTVKVSSTYTAVKHLLTQRPTFDNKDPISAFVNAQAAFTSTHIACKALQITPKQPRKEHQAKPAPEHRAKPATELKVMRSERPSKISSEFARDKIMKLVGYLASRPVGQNSRVIDNWTKNLDVQDSTLLGMLEDVGLLLPNAFGDYVLTSNSDLLGCFLSKFQ